MRSGRRLAVDVGKARVGLAICDYHGILASGLATVARASELQPTCEAIIRALHDAQIEPNDLLEVYVGLPTNLKGLQTESTLDALAVANALAIELAKHGSAAQIRLIDERMTTVSAAAALRSSGINSKKGRSVIDQVAATLILEQALSQEQATGQEPGIELSEYEGEE